MTPPLHKSVLTTLNDDGTRRWLHPKLARGKWLNRRRIVGYALIVLFVLLPRVRIGGRPALLIDLVDREVSVFGALFRPTDGVLLMLLGLTIVLTVFLVTALFGRVWCGWGCPQTVYLEHVFRPIERWLERRHWTPGKTRAVKLAIYAAISFALSNVFLAYFVGTDRLETWVFESPLEHTGGFLLVVGVSALMLFDFAYFREQMCIVACPYGRLQSVLLDKDSLIIAYDKTRGEPRGKLKKHLPVLGNTGDCVSCSACVSVCPTGIDIRDGLQMECIGCAQCIDACDAIMDKVGKPRGLIGYTKGKLLRGRTIVYPVLLAVVVSMFVLAVHGKSAAEVFVERATGPSFVELADGTIAAQVLLKVENETDADKRYAFSLVDAPDATLRSVQPSWTVKAHAAITVPLFVDVAATTFAAGKRPIKVRIDDSEGFERVISVTLLGPERGTP